jgi:hypothetical protein
MPMQLANSRRLRVCVAAGTELVDVSVPCAASMPMISACGAVVPEGAKRVAGEGPGRSERRNGQAIGRRFVVSIAGRFDRGCSACGHGKSRGPASGPPATGQKIQKTPIIDSFFMTLHTFVWRN